MVPFPSLSNLLNTHFRFDYDKSFSFSEVAARNSLKPIDPDIFASTYSIILVTSTC